ncbi:MAG TPA: glycoside hydrolase family 20 zincin-like fold domain-containing protein [Acidisarcina sp.]|nr:glycoside hydrolase family 20 zincin-like fold domain-containing protein [Acidisarcina sp.]
MAAPAGILYLLATLVAPCPVRAQKGVSTSDSAAGKRATLRLIPQPREVSHDKLVSLAHGVVVRVDSSDAQDRFAADDLRQALSSREVRPSSTDPQRLQIELLRASEPRARRLLSAGAVQFDDAMKPEGYVLLPGAHSLAIIASSAEGMFYGAQTVKQLVVGSGRSAQIHSVLVRDWPALRYRGISDDLSRGPVPTLEYQKRQVRIFSAFKINIYSPYFESTLAYSGNPLAASPGGAMTRSDVEQLVRYAGQYHVTVVPEQEAFGHLHNVLTYEQYAPLAETPHGHVLAPGQPGSIALITQWFTEIAGMFPGPFVHIGADETFDLGRGQTSAEVQQKGLGATYVAFLKQIRNALQPLNKKILFWGDLAWNDPALVKTLPKDMIAVPWVYGPQPKGFARFILPFKEAGMETWVAPGVSNWNRVYPNNNTALLNIQGFVRDGQRLGSTGALTTVWDDDGEGLFDQDWYGVIFSAAASWQPGESSIEQFQQSYGAVFHGDATGKIDEAERELAAAHAILAKADLGDASNRLFWMDPWSVEGKIAAKKLRPVVHDFRLHAERAMILLAEAESQQKLRESDTLRGMELGARRMDLIGLKFQLSDEIILGYGRAYAEQKDSKLADNLANELYDIAGNNGRCQDILSGYSANRDLYEQAWLRENRTYWLHNVLARYDHAMDLWLGRRERVTGIIDQWYRTRTLPRPEDVGIPASLND